MNNYNNYTNFVDDIEDNDFDGFLNQRGREKRAKRKDKRQARREERGGGIKDMVMEQRDKLLGRRPRVMALAEQIREAKKNNMTLPEWRRFQKAQKKVEMSSSSKMYRKPTIKAMVRPIDIGDRKMATRQAKIDAKAIAQEENDAILNGDTIGDEVVMTTRPMEVESEVLEIDAPTPSFFQKNKKMIMLVGGAVALGVVYFKFINK